MTNFIAIVLETAASVRSSIIQTGITKIIDGIPTYETVMLMARYNYEVKVFPKNCVEQLPN